MIGVNIYRFRFTAVCPADGENIEYEAEIASRSMIRVEEINQTTAAMTTGFHEAIADQLWARFQGQQEIRAVHQGVSITTRRAAIGPLLVSADVDGVGEGALHH